MTNKRLLIIAVIVALLGAYIYFFERHQPTTEEAEALAEKLFPDLDSDEVEAIELSNSHGDFRFEKRADDWHLTEPIDFAADSMAVGGMITSLTGLEAKRRLAAAEVDPATYRLDDPEMRVILTLQSGEAVELRVGAEAALGSDRAVALSADEVIMVTGWFTSDLDRGLSAWRSKEVVQVYPDQVASIDIDSGEDRIRAVRIDTRWHLLEPVDDLADEDHLRDLISNLNSLQVKAFVDEPGTEAELGLDAPRYRVDIIRSTGDEPTVMEFGRIDEQDGTTRVLCRRNHETVFWVGDGAERALGKAPVRWRSQAVFPFETWDVDAVTFNAYDKTVALERREGVWRVADSEEAANGSAVLERLTALRELRVVDFDLVPPGTVQYGSIELRLAGSGLDDEEDEGKALGFTFFEPLAEGGNVLVQASERRTLMSVAPEQVEAILGELDLLRQAETWELETEEAPAGEPEGAD